MEPVIYCNSCKLSDDLDPIEPLSNLSFFDLKVMHKIADFKLLLMFIFRISIKRAKLKLSMVKQCLHSATTH
jgi:hypothetical protein